VTPNQGLAQVVGATTNFLFNLFGGFIITYPVRHSRLIACLPSLRHLAVGT
jgi:hypothetical protein